MRAGGIILGKQEFLRKEWFGIAHECANPSAQQNQKIDEKTQTSSSL